MGRMPWIAALGLLCLDIAHAGQPQTFRGGTDLVTFGVTVTDRRGGVVGDLTADEFEVVEDNRPQRV